MSETTDFLTWYRAVQRWHDDVVVTDEPLSSWAATIPGEASDLYPLGDDDDMAGE